MKALLIVGLTAAVAAGIGMSARAGESQQGRETAAGAWQQGSCYRVFPENRDTYYTFKVVEPLNGVWVRVEAFPPPPLSPGSKPLVRQWLNTESVFMVQEWECSF